MVPLIIASKISIESEVRGRVVVEIDIDFAWHSWRRNDRSLILPLPLVVSWWPDPRLLGLTYGRGPIVSL